MKTKRFWGIILPLFILATVFMPSCSCSREAKKEGSVIPKDAAVITAINLGSIWEKGELNNMANLNTTKELRKVLEEGAPGLASMVAELLKNPSSSGVDFSANLVVFLTSDQSSSDGNSYMVMSATLKDKKDFEKMISNMASSVNITDYKMYDDKKADLSFAEFHDFVFAYNKKRVLMVSAYMKPATPAAMSSYATKLFSLDDSESIASLESFKEFWEKRGDIGVFCPMGNMMELNKSYKSLLGSSNVFANALKNTSFYYTVTFEKGSIDIKFNTINAPAELGKVFGKSFNANIIKYMPDNAILAATYVIDIDYIAESVDNITAESFKTLADIFGGSVVACIYDMKGDKAIFAAALDIKDKATIKAKLDENNPLHKGDIYFVPMLDANVFLADDAIVISNDDKLIERAIQGGYSNSLMNIAEKAKKGNYMYLDLDIRNYPEELINKIYDDKHYDEEYAQENEEYREFKQKKLKIRKKIVNTIFNIFRYVEAETVDGGGLIIRIYTSRNDINSLQYIITKGDQIIE